MQRAPPIVRRWVPFVAVAAANCINIPVMRQRELMDGIMVTDKEGNNLAKSKVSTVGTECGESRRVGTFAQVAARMGISLVTLSRIFIVAPSMSELIIIVCQ